jgi:hypothetical protein
VSLFEKGGYRCSPKDKRLEATSVKYKEKSAITVTAITEKKAWTADFATRKASDCLHTKLFG